MAKVTTNFIPEVDWDNFHPTNENYDQIKQIALDLARSTLDIKKLKAETLDWVRKEWIGTDFAAMEAVENWRFLSVGKYYFILNRKGNLDDICLAWLEAKTEALLTIGKDHLVDLAEKEKKEPVVQPIDPKFRDEMIGLKIAQDMEDLVLEGIFPGDYESAYNILDQNKPSPAILRHLIENLRKFVDELHNFSEKEIDEGFLNQKSFMKTRNAMGELLNLAQTYSTNAKTRRKVSRRRKSSNYGSQGRTAKAVSQVRYKIEDRELRLVSVDPVSILGAKGLLVFNTKNRKVGLYIASDEGLEVKGTTIQGFDEEKSRQKTLRKPGELLDSFRDATFKRASIILDKNIRAKAGKMNGRLNNHIIIMKVWKK